jgi:hypothetical protein
VQNATRAGRGDCDDEPMPVTASSSNRDASSCASGSLRVARRVSNRLRPAHLHADSAQGVRVLARLGFEEAGEVDVHEIEDAPYAEP